MRFGIGKADITYIPGKNPCMGFAVKTHTTKGILNVEVDGREIELRQYARAFIIEGHVNDSREGDIPVLFGKGKIVVVVADIWSCTANIKDMVIDELGSEEYTHDNVMICGTHTHSGAAFKTGYRLFDSSHIKSEKHAIRNTDKIATGIIIAIRYAEQNFREGNHYTDEIILCNGQIGTQETSTEGYVCGKNRSKTAYRENNNYIRNRYHIDEEEDYYPEDPCHSVEMGDTDKTMQLLKFVRKANMCGILNWYPIHPNSMGSHSHKINSDNKGLAELLLEQEYPNTIAAFANSNCGDVSPNVHFNKVEYYMKWNPDKNVIYGRNDDRTLSKRVSKGEESDKEGLIYNGKAQYLAARHLLEDGIGLLLDGPVFFQHDKIDMSNVALKRGRTYEGTLGLSMLAGGSADGPSPLTEWPIVKKYAKEGITEDNSHSFMQALAELGSQKNVFYEFPLILPPILKAVIGAYGKRIDNLSDRIRRGHYPKPIAIRTTDIAPSELPLQLFQIGSLAIIGFPGEITTVAGRRLKKAVQDKFNKYKINIDNIVVQGYTNDYAQYTTTFEEYQAQYYEGASTYFGPHTLDAYIKHYKKLTGSIVQKQIPVKYQTMRATFKKERDNINADREYWLNWGNRDQREQDHEMYDGLNVYTDFDLDFDPERKFPYDPGKFQS